MLGDDVTVYDDRNRRYIYGRETVVEHVKNNVIGADGEKPVKRLVIYDPLYTLRAILRWYRSAPPKKLVVTPA